ncbi:hypothetical protein Q7O60_04665 [Pseudomonas protegens]|uniref:hypothetical protein n=1 Tax=Pseudomonas protegens TaxID=380021 RepID=UPI00274B2C4D|nr:hypothetical protein [Pseudomonas protegens]MDP9502283.1 hypothetical protein [Pseudomonas protegens]
MKLWPLHAGTRRPWYVKLLWIPLLFGLVTHWDIALPTVNVHADGDIDRREKSGTDEHRLAECRWDRAKP